MTLIECFTESHIDNIAACLRLQPDQMIMVGNAEGMGVPVDRYKKLLKQRGQNTNISLCDVRGKDFEEICGAIGKLVREAENCVIDLTGGDEPVIMAVGAVLAALDLDARQRLRVEKLDHDAGEVRDCIHDNRILPYKPVKLTVEEVVALHGGKVLPDTNPFLDGGNHRDIDALWAIVSENPKAWNRAISYLTEFERGTDGQTHVCLHLDDLVGIANYDQKESVVRELLDRLARCGIIEDRSSRDVLDYTYKSSMLRYCTRKAGNILEIKTLLEGRGTLENGAPYFHDCRMSVSIDWDGVLHNPAERVPETRNEIDVVLMHGMTPLFISCKNGNIGDEELYKLNTVAGQFGGPHARKMLIATDLDQKSPSANRSFSQRAWDMDIFLETDAAELSRKEWSQIFKKAMQ